MYNSVLVMSGRKVANNFCLTFTEHLLFYTVKTPLKMTIRMNYPTEDKINFDSQSLIHCKWYLQKKRKGLNGSDGTWRHTDAKKVENKK